MITITIDGKTVTAEPGSTILRAAAAAGIAIPSLCQYEGIEPPVSCFVCVVKLEGRMGFIPSCVAQVEEGMVISSETDGIRDYRRSALELLLSEHAGDCESPCRRICPCGMDIPAMARCIARGDAPAALRTVKEMMAFPAILGYICPAPCQKGCRRAKVDTCIAIRELHLQVASTQYARTWLPEVAPASGKKVAVVGAGPAGLSAAWYLSVRGYGCTVFDSHERPGGTLAFGVSPKALPPAVLENEIAQVRQLGVVFKLQTAIGRDIGIEVLEREFDAVVLATGEQDDAARQSAGVGFGSKGISVASGTFRTARPKVFACGAAIRPGKLAARSMGEGREVAAAIDRFFKNGEPLVPLAKTFDCHLGNLREGEIGAYTAACAAAAENFRGGMLDVTTASEAARCLSCDCAAKTRCDLRRLAAEYGVDQRRYRIGKRRSVEIKVFSSGLRYESGKCISCGRCVGIARAADVRPGLSFIQRGFDVRVEAPFDCAFDTAMGAAAGACAAACPTGALSMCTAPPETQ